MPRSARPPNGTARARTSLRLATCRILLAGFAIVRLARISIVSQLLACRGQLHCRRSPECQCYPGKQASVWSEGWIVQTILITGASSGFGAHVAAKLAARGWRVIASMRDTTKTTQLDELMEGAGTTTALLEIIRLDVACDESRASAADYVLDSTPHGLTAVLHCAGYTTAGFFEHLTPQTIRDLLEANFIGAVDLTQRLLPTMRSQGHGTIAVISSNAVNIAHPMYSIYAAAKWALEGWAEAIDIELAPFGLDVKILQPGNHDTPFGRNVQPVLPEDSPYAPLGRVSQ
ncbi:MAG: SDR family NAD(P)-dependent oxidoreductase [Hyphomicrobiales bacterium]|nr:MAG: SDR family NAD(P)-dependent oxidoreductase [Hyphomicrobiales bacterium]